MAFSPFLAVISGGGNCAEKVAKMGFFLLTLGLLSEAELELKSFERNEFFRSKLLEGCGESFSEVSSLTCFSAFAASFLDNLKDPPLEDKLRRDFLEIRKLWLRSKLKEDSDEDSFVSTISPFVFGDELLIEESEKRMEFID